MTMILGLIAGTALGKTMAPMRVCVSNSYERLRAMQHIYLAGGDPSKSNPIPATRFSEVAGVDLIVDDEVIHPTNLALSLRVTRIAAEKLRNGAESIILTGADLDPLVSLARGAGRFGNMPSTLATPGAEVSIGVGVKINVTWNGETRSARCHLVAHGATKTITTTVLPAERITPAQAIDRFDNSYQDLLIRFDMTTPVENRGSIASSCLAVVDREVKRNADAVATEERALVQPLLSTYFRKDKGRFADMTTEGVNVVLDSLPSDWKFTASQATYEIVGPYLDVWYSATSPQRPGGSGFSIDLSVLRKRLGN